MKRIIIALILALVLLMALGGPVLADITPVPPPEDGPGKSYDAPAKGHQGVPGEGKGHEKARGRGHEIHSQDGGGLDPI